ncbi:CENPB DNA-binding domain-containing protein 1 [Portunus trituberculatus]|uniref:CENPB DNA-binding domain-containing protein 1 n=1 Tax=Portunus trituberculatus TaxID=210409 RepID=A0A5B7J819_PORTR|nr:CENPB DNA-binding domain-containing protein 1 [Portunus trituberculatus]
MSSKQAAISSAGELKTKRPRKNLSLEKKFEIVKRHEGAERANFIARTMQLSHSTVSTIIKQAESVKKTGETASTLIANMLTRKREPIMKEIERPLGLWIDDQRFTAKWHLLT